MKNFHFTTTGLPHKKPILFIALLLIADLCLLYPFLLLIGNFLIIQNPLQKADLITVISGPGYRTEYAIELYKQGWGQKLFFTGGFCAEHPPSDADWSQKLALKSGISPDAVNIDDANIISTYQEALRLKQYLDEHASGIKSVILVTDVYHTRRAQWIYEKVIGNQAKIIMASVPFEEAGYSKKWWLSGDSRKMVAEEYLKLVFYLFRYQLASGKFQTWLSFFDRF